ncbi:MAG: DUF2156 domain-containing protein [Methanomicrobiaceae archaeon]|uniref:Phosphatidylglycerol lysyltransferase C-terminal domain-containing protein n=1 Tax=hydrocarbon metagenome TaxID=938273 RepID=A0A0W8FH23_9ZZZZ|nr:DUF2156 domain-containing protein [Methanomicrobiaceae archaeon]MDD5419661.1 phosphatidylglycerol lysyltransferase domain-containing protein [Methanomicrobiaceae archaeon]
MLKQADFLPVSLKDRDRFREHYRQYPVVHSDNTLANLLCWNHYAHYRRAFVRDCIVLSSTIEGKTKFRSPIGPRDPELLQDVIDLAVREGDDAPLIMLDPESKAWIEAAWPGISLYPDRDFFDYVYLSSDLADLPGRRYFSTRRHFNRFRRDYSYTAEPISADAIDEVREFLLVWCDWKDCDSVPILAYEKDAVLYAIDHFEDLGLCGCAIRIGGTIGAISVAGKLNGDTAVVHFEKGLPDTYRGIYRAINIETAKMLKNKYQYINRECDMGAAGLRESKTRYHPHHMVEVHVAPREELGRIGHGVKG